MLRPSLSALTGPATRHSGQWFAESSRAFQRDLARLHGARRHHMRLSPTTTTSSSSSSPHSGAAPRRTTAAMLGLGVAAVTVYAQWMKQDLLLDEDAHSSASAMVKQPSGQDLIPYEEVQRHATKDECWVIINGSVYDVTDFLERHPGGEAAILAMAGSDVSEVFNSLHPSDAIQLLPPEAHLGAVDPSTLPARTEGIPKAEERRRMDAREEMPAAEDMLLVQDFEEWAQRVLSGTAWSYYRSAADEEHTFQENRHAFQRYFLRPRILRDMTHGSLNTTVLGIPTSMPLFISPAAMAKLGHPLGEVNLTRAAGDCGVVQAISSNASCSLDEMFGAAARGQPLIFQLYLNKDRSASEALIKRVDKLGAKAIMFTVDVCWASKRTLDVRAKSSAKPSRPVSPSASSATATPTATPAAMASATAPPSAAPAGIAEAIGGYQDRNLTWEDISFIRKHTKLPIIVKGVQSLEDVVQCVENGVEGVILSNHGGRQADYAPAPIDILYEIRCYRPDLFAKIEIMIDGGIRTGADVVKALALGAKAVGIGRPILYANGTHGEEGVRRVLEIFREEITNTMRNCGVSRVEDLRPEMVGPAGPWVGWNRPVYVPAPPPPSPTPFP